MIRCTETRGAVVRNIAVKLAKHTQARERGLTCPWLLTGLQLFGAQRNQQDPCALYNAQSSSMRSPKSAYMSSSLLKGMTTAGASCAFCDVSGTLA